MIKYKDVNEDLTLEDYLAYINALISRKTRQRKWVYKYRYFFNSLNGTKLSLLEQAQIDAVNSKIHSFANTYKEALLPIYFTREVENGERVMDDTKLMEFGRQLKKEVDNLKLYMKEDARLAKLVYTNNDVIRGLEEERRTLLKDIHIYDSITNVSITTDEYTRVVN